MMQRVRAISLNSFSLEGAVRIRVPQAPVVRGTDRFSESLYTNPHLLEVPMTSSQTYLLGFIILILGLAGAAYLLAVPPVWIAIGVVILIGIGIMAAANYSGPADH